MKKLFISICICLYTLSYNINAQIEPLITVHNTTNIDMQCIVECVYYLPENAFEKFDIKFNANKNHNIFVNWIAQVDEHGNDYLQMFINFDCNNNSITTLNNLIYFNNAPCNVIINSVECKNHRLQIQTWCNLTSADQPKVVISYQPDYGFDISPEKKSLYVTCAHNFKQMLQSLLLAALQATNYLPY